jgi:hypothetical protein
MKVSEIMGTFVVEMFAHVFKIYLGSDQLNRLLDVFNESKSSKYNSVSYDCH